MAFPTLCTQVLPGALNPLLVAGRMLLFPYTWVAGLLISRGRRKSPSLVGRFSCPAMGVLAKLAAPISANDVAPLYTQELRPGCQERLKVPVTWGLPHLVCPKNPSTTPMRNSLDKPAETHGHKSAPPNHPDTPGRPFHMNQLPFDPLRLLSGANTGKGSRTIPRPHALPTRRVITDRLGFKPLSFGLTCYTAES